MVVTNGRKVPAKERQGSLPRVHSARTHVALCDDLDEGSLGTPAGLEEPFGEAGAFTSNAASAAELWIDGSLPGPAPSTPAGFALITSLRLRRQPPHIVVPHSSRERPGDVRKIARNGRGSNPQVSSPIRPSPQVARSAREHSQGGDTGSNPVGTTRRSAGQTPVQSESPVSWARRPAFVPRTSATRHGRTCRRSGIGSCRVTEPRDPPRYMQRQHQHREHQDVE
jgi:hypothetical protein